LPYIFICLTLSIIASITRGPNKLVLRFFPGLALRQRRIDDKLLNSFSGASQIRPVVSLDFGLKLFALIAILQIFAESIYNGSNQLRRHPPRCPKLWNAEIQNGAISNMQADAHLKFLYPASMKH